MELALEARSMPAIRMPQPRPHVFGRESWLSPALRDVILRLPDCEGRTAEHIFDTLRDTVPGYRDSAAAENPSDVYRHCLLTTQTWHRALLAGRSLTAGDTEALFGLGAQKFRLGVQLGNLLHAFRVGSMLLWDELVVAGERDRSLSGELLSKVSRFHMSHFDTVSQFVGRGYGVEAQRVARRRPKAVALHAPDETAMVEPLSKREVTVLRLVEMGRTNKEIARDLFVSEDTIKYHLKNIYGKLGAHRRTEAVARAQSLGLAVG
jgi:DNA-binding CsgD family transcriptional regulator